MAEVGVKRLGTGDGETCGAEHDEGDAGMRDEERHRMMRAQRSDDARIVPYVDEPEHGQRREPQRHHGPEQRRDIAGAA